MEKKEKDDIVALVYEIDKSKSISDTKKNCSLLFDYIQQELDKAREEEYRKGYLDGIIYQSEIHTAMEGATGSMPPITE